MKEISSAALVKNIDEVDWENYPRFVMKNAMNDRTIVDQLLKVLLPISKITYEVQERNVEQAQIASQLQKKQSTINTRTKKNENFQAQRLSYLRNNALFLEANAFYQEEEPCNCSNQTEAELDEQSCCQ